jgi:hypothetical protein
VKLLSTAAELGAEERGGTLVIVTLWLPVLILFAALVVDVGSWFTHKRHLQMQADAGALAAGGLFAVPCTGAVDGRIEAEARKYAGDPSAPASYNAQINTSLPGNVHFLINATKYWNEGGTSYSDGGSPCDAQMVDVKLTEERPPRFFGPLVPAINANARVEIRRLERPNGLLPIGMPEVNPRVVAATFFNSDTGAAITPPGRIQLTPSGDLGFGATTLSGWSSAPTQVPIDVKHIGLRIALGGAMSTSCGDPNVDCYDDVDFLRGSPSRAGTPEAPVARDVWLSSADPACPDPYFSPLESGSCRVEVNADVDFGADPASVAASVTAKVGNREYGLTHDSGSGLWRGDVIMPAASGLVEIKLRWDDQCGPAEKKCGDWFDDPRDTKDYVQRSYTADESLAGPLKFVLISRSDGSYGVNSFPLGSKPILVVTIGVPTNLRIATDVAEPPIQLRVFKENDEPSASRNHSLDCDPGYPNFWQEIAYGCEPPYVKHDLATPCPPSIPTLWRSAQPWSCVAVDTGARRDELARGMNVRVFGTERPATCTAPNNWRSFPGISPDDPRIVTLFVTPFNAFRTSGTGTVPVTEFAAFYVTGWNAAGSGFDNPCQGNGDDPAPAGFLVGHFIKYISPLNNGGAGDELCDFATPDLCVAVLTR